MNNLDGMGKGYLLYLILVLLWLGLAGTTAFVAHQKGRDWTVWLGSGLLLGVFAFLAVAASPPQWEQPKKLPQGDSEPQGKTNAQEAPAYDTASIPEAGASPLLAVSVVFVLAALLGVIMLYF